MARSKNDETQTAKDQALAELTAQVNAEIPADNPESVELQNAIERANVALDEKASILARIQSARELATLLIENGSGSQAQVLWVRQYLPRKTRNKDGAEDEGTVENGEDA